MGDLTAGEPIKAGDFVGVGADGKVVSVRAHESLDLDAKRKAIERIITASFRAGCEIGRLYREPVEPIIDWDGQKPRITGYKVVAV